MATGFKPCLIVDCNGNAHRSKKGAKGYCKAHYSRLLRYGDPLAGLPPRGQLLEFIEQVALLFDGKECLIWPFGVNSKGYGCVTVDGKKTYAHRYICERKHGAPPTATHQAAHSCGKGHLGCVHPAHLSWKTPIQNKADELVHGTRARGERMGTVKLTEGQVRTILGLKGVRTQKEISKQFGVAQIQISRIHRGERWSWLRP